MGFVIRACSMMMFTPKLFESVCSTTALLTLVIFLFTGASEKESDQQPYVERAASFFNSGKYDSALVNYLKAEKVIMQSGDWSGLADCKNSIAEVYRLLSDSEHSLAYSNEVIAICAAHLPGRPEALAKAYEISGKVYDYNVRDFAKAKELYAKALAIRQARYGAEHPVIAENYFLLGRVYLNTGQLSEAGVQFKRAEDMKIKLEGANSLSLYDLYLSEAVLYRRLLKFDNALNYYQRAQHLWEVNGKSQDHPSFGILAYGMGNLYIEEGQYEDAITQYKLALKNFLTCYGESDFHVSATYSNIGAAYSNQMDLAEALDYYNKALTVYKTILEENHPFITSLYIDFCDLYFNFGKYEEAIRYGRQAISLLEIRYNNEPNRELGIACFYTGSALLRAEKFDEALPLLDKSVFIFKAMDEKYLLSDAYASRGAAFQGLQQETQAEKDFLSAIHELESDSGNLHLAYAYRAYATFTNHLGDFHKALALANKGLRQLGIHFSDPYDLSSIDSLYTVDFLSQLLPERGVALLGIYKSEHDTSALHAALKNYEALTDLFMRIIQESKAERSKLLQLPSLASYYEKAVACALSLYNETHDRAFKEKTFEFAEQSKAVLLWQYVHDTKARRFAGIPEDIIHQERSMKEQLSYVESKLNELPREEASARDILQKQHFAIRARYDSLLDNLQKDYPAYYALRYKRPSVNVRELMQSLQEGEGIIEYLTGEDSLYLFLMSSAELEIISLPNNPSLARDAARFTKALTERVADECIDRARSLYKALFLPAEPFLRRSHITVITVIPDGFISYVPMESLIAAEDGINTPAYLLFSYTFHYQFSASLIPAYRQMKRRSVKNNFAGFAPSFAGDGQSNGQLTALAHTAEEVNYITDKLGGQSFIGDAATEANFKKTASEYRIIHLATHAVMDDDEADISRLYFTPGNDSIEDNKLYAYELFNLEIPAQLVTLSACNTGAGKFHKGEGVMSLSRAFAYAGCPSIVTSLWQAQDRSTASLMKYFYENLADGLSKDEALREAKIRYIKESDKIKSHPFFWAGFILVGDERPIAEPFTLGWGLLLFAIAAIVFVTGVVGFMRIRKYGRKSGRGNH